MVAELPIKLYVFDADGTLRGCTVPGQPCPNRPGEWELLPGVRERLRRIAWDERRGPHFAVATNQGGVGLGYFTAEAARRLVVDTAEAALGRAPAPGAIEICTHAPHANCPCRKPKAEMLRRLMRRFRARPEETLYVGDMETDAEAARRAGCRFQWARDFFGWNDDAQSETGREDARPDDARQDDVPRGDVLQKEARPDDARRGATRQYEARRDTTRRGEVRRDEVHLDEVRRDETRPVETSRGEARLDEARRGAVSRDEDRRRAGGGGGGGGEG
jgi:D-glycero-D-manno-heptose 1,7-bisphosphate phosphatase